MRNIIVVTLYIYHFTRSIGMVVYEFIGRFIEIHGGVKPKIFYTTGIPNFYDAQRNRSAKFMMLRKWAIELW